IIEVLARQGGDDRPAPVLPEGKPPLPTIDAVALVLAPGCPAIGESLAELDLAQNRGRRHLRLRATRGLPSTRGHTRHDARGMSSHSLVPDFVIQGGDPTGTGSGGPGYSLPTENQVAEPLGTLAMAATSVPSGSQFYIVVGQGPAPKYNVSMR